MGQRLVIVFSPLGGCVSFTPFRLRAVASALSLPESWLFFLLWICRFTGGSSGAVPRGSFWGSREGWIFQFSPWFEFCLTFSFPFLGVLTRDWSGLPLPGVTSPVWSPGRFWLLGAGSRLASPFRSLAPSFSGVGAVRMTVSPLFPRLLRCALAYGLTVSPLPHYRWSRVHGQASAGLSSVGFVRGYTAPVGWLRGAFPCFAYCPTSSVLKRSSFGFSASCFASSLRDGVTLPG